MLYFLNFYGKINYNNFREAIILDKIPFAIRFREALNLRNMKQSELCEKTNIGKSAISQYLSGSFEPKQQNVYKIALALDVSEAWLMGYDVPITRATIENGGGWAGNSFHIQEQPKVDTPIYDKAKLNLIENYDKMNDTARNTLIKYSEFMVSQPENLRDNTIDNKQ